MYLLPPVPKSLEATVTALGATLQRKCWVVTDREAYIKALDIIATYHEERPKKKLSKRAQAFNAQEGDEGWGR